MLRIQRPWRDRLADVDAPELYYLETPNTASTVKTGGSAENEGVKRERDETRGFEEATTNKNKPQNLVEDEPVGDDFKEGSPNYAEAFDLAFLRERRIINTFAAIVSKVAEDLSGWPIPGDDEWSVNDLMERHISRKPLTQCRQSRERESVVVILDTSGSCLPQAKFYSRIADAAVQSGDVELYAAPNAGLEARLTRRGWEKADHRVWPFRNRTIIFFGDYDGGNHVVEASWHNKVYWFCSEGDRYPDMKVHPWCSYTMKHFKGRYYDCNHDEDFLRLLRKVR